MSTPETLPLIREATAADHTRLRALVTAAGLPLDGLDAATAVLVAGAGGSLALLTQTAADWFPRFGFIPVDRSSLPLALEGSEELRGVCPVSDQAMLPTSPSRPSA